MMAEGRFASLPRSLHPSHPLPVSYTAQPGSAGAAQPSGPTAWAASMDLISSRPGPLSGPLSGPPSAYQSVSIHGTLPRRPKGGARPQPAPGHYTWDPRTNHTQPTGSAMPSAGNSSGLASLAAGTASSPLFHDITSDQRVYRQPARPGQPDPTQDYVKFSRERFTIKVSPEKLRKELEEELKMSCEEPRSHAWYHGAIPREVAESSVQRDGDFLIRDSLSSPGSYVLTCQWRDTAQHFKINRKVSAPSEAYCRVEYRLDRESFHSLPALVHFYVGNRKPVSQMAGAIIFQPINRGLPLRCLEEKYGLVSVHTEAGLTLPERRSQKRLSLNLLNGHAPDNTHTHDNGLDRGNLLRVTDRCGSQPASLNQVQERRHPLQTHQSEGFLPLGCRVAAPQPSDPPLSPRSPVFRTGSEPVLSPSATHPTPQPIRGSDSQLCPRPPPKPSKVSSLRLPRSPGLQPLAALASSCSSSIPPSSSSSSSPSLGAPSLGSSVPPEPPAKPLKLQRQTLTQRSSDSQSTSQSASQPVSQNGQSTCQSVSQSNGQSSTQPASMFNTQYASQPNGLLTSQSANQLTSQQNSQPAGQLNGLSTKALPSLMSSQTNSQCSSPPLGVGAGEGEELQGRCGPAHCGPAPWPPACSHSSYVGRLRHEQEVEEEKGRRSTQVEEEKGRRSTQEEVEEERGRRKALDRSSYHHAIAALENTSEEEESEEGGVDRGRTGEEEEEGEEEERRRMRRNSVGNPSRETVSAFRPAEFASRLLPIENKPLEMSVLKRAKELLLCHQHHSIALHLLQADCQVARILGVSAEVKGQMGVASGVELVTLPHGGQLRLDLMERHHTMAIGVAVDILGCTGSMDERAATMNRIILVAMELKEAVGDMFSFTALMKALDLPQIVRLEQTWTALRRSFTETAITYEKTLKPFYNSLNQGTADLPPTVSVPHLLPLLSLMERPAVVMETGWEGDEQGCDIMLRHLQYARVAAGNAHTYTSNAQRLLQGFTSDEDLLEVMTTDFQLRLLWGSRGAAVNQSDRYAKFNLILNALSRKLEL